MDDVSEAIGSSAGVPGSVVNGESVTYVDDAVVVLHGNGLTLPAAVRKVRP